MHPYRYLDHPDPDPAHQVHVRLQLDPDDVLAGECVAAESLGHDRYRILNVPITTTEVGLHDIVLALELDDEPEYVEVLTRRSHVRFNFEMSARRPARSIHSLEHHLGVAVEQFGRLFVANLPDRRNATGFQQFLERHADWFERVDLVGATRSRRRRENVGAGGNR